jgi:hypothetical protein
MVFSWHTGLGALVMPGPSGTPIAVKAADLRQAGRKVDEETMRKALPRADVSSILAAGGAADIAQAVAETRAKGKLDQVVRGR